MTLSPSVALDVVDIGLGRLHFFLSRSLQGGKKKRKETLLPLFSISRSSSGLFTPSLNRNGRGRWPGRGAGALEAGCVLVERRGRLFVAALIESFFSFSGARLRAPRVRFSASGPMQMMLSTFFVLRRG